jgi:hypothetical protein
MKAVQSNHADAMKQLKRDAKEKVATAELAGKRSDLKVQSAAKAKKKANEEKEEANAEEKNMAMSLVAEAAIGGTREGAVGAVECGRLPNSEGDEPSRAVARIFKTGGSARL